MDAARTAQRLTGRPATVVYRRTKAEMPAEEGELEDLLAEDNVLMELASPNRVILKDGRVAALECVRNELGEPGPDGRRKPVRVVESEFEIEADSIILAIGQSPDVAFLDGSSVTLHKDGSIAVDAETGLAGTSCVYAGGDAARGPAIIIQACADGRRAAEAICAEFGIEFKGPPTLSLLRAGSRGAAQPGALSADDILQVKRVRARKETQHRPAALPVTQRAGFDLVEQTLTEESARSEAARCVQCATLCDKCVEVCPNRANYTYLVAPVSLTLPQLSCKDGELMIAGEETFEIDQTRQIIHVDDFCNECGNCATFCVHAGKPYLEKPRLFLEADDFQREDDNAFYVETNIIRRREGGRESQLSVQNSTIIFENAHVRVNLSSDLEIKEMALKEAFEGTLSLEEAAEMALILRGITTSVPFLIV
jgi:putative selenate reductase